MLVAIGSLSLVFSVCFTNLDNSYYPLTCYITLYLVLIHTIISPWRDITQIYLTGCFLVQLLIIMMEHISVYFKSISCIFIFYSTFLKVEVQENPFCF